MKTCLVSVTSRTLEYSIAKQKGVANCVWMLVVKIEGIERTLLENRFTKETCLSFSMSEFGVPKLVRDSFFLARWLLTLK